VCVHACASMCLSVYMLVCVCACACMSVRMCVEGECVRVCTSALS